MFDVILRRFRMVDCSQVVTIQFNIHASQVLLFVTVFIPIIILIVKKLKCTIVQSLRLCTSRMVHRASRGIALLIHDLGTRRG